MNYVNTADTTQHKAPALVRLWNWITHVHPSITDPEARYQGRIFLALAGMLVLVEISFRLLNWVELSPFHQIHPLYPTLIFTLSLVTYLLGRTRWYLWAIRLSIGLVIASLFAALAVSHNPTAFQVLPSYLLIGIFLASLFFRVRAALVVAVVCVVGILLLPLIVPAFDWVTAINHVRFIISLSFLIYISTFMRRQAQRVAGEQAQALMQSEARYRSLFEASFEPLVIIHDGRVVDMNHEVETLLGYGAEEVKGKSLLNFLHRDDWKQVLANTGTTGEHRYELRFIRKDGSAFYADVRTKPHVHQGQPMRVASVRDITAQRELEAQRLELALESDRDALLQKLLGNLSHDFRTPLSVIKTSLYLLERTRDDATKHEKQIDTVRLQTQRLHEMLEDFMTLTRLDHTRKGDFDDGEFEVIGFIRDVVREHEALAAKHGVRLTYDEAMDLPRVRASEYTLRRILKRLLTNAISYTPENGSVTLTADLSGDELGIRVQDSGIGIAPEDLPHIFDHFYRADKARNTESGGAGLGLTIAHRLAEMVGGSIEVVSAVNEGSTFTIRLPVQVLEAAKSPQSHRFPPARPAVASLPEWSNERVQDR
jgi:PAS domain S-box-containing protein